VGAWQTGGCGTGHGAVLAAEGAGLALAGFGCLVCVKVDPFRCRSTEYSAPPYLIHSSPLET
jgi:hypothetical protein